MLFVPAGYRLDTPSTSLDTFYLHCFLILAQIEFELREGKFTTALHAYLLCGNGNFSGKRRKFLVVSVWSISISPARCRHIW